VYRLDPASIPEFHTRYAGLSPENGVRAPLPTGVRPECWQKGCEGIFLCEPMEGMPVLGLTNLTEVTATQYSIDLEIGCNCPLEDDREYTIRMEYKTRGRPEAHIHVQTQKYDWVEGKPFEPSDDHWTVATMKFRRPPGATVRIAIGVKSGGPDTSLFLRSVEVVQ
jgi:hypothetical protein